MKASCLKVRPHLTANPSGAIPSLQLGSDSEATAGDHFSCSAEWESSEEDSSLSPTGKLYANNIELGPERKSRRELFQKMRKDHYRMKEAIRRGRELVKSESEHSEGEESSPIESEK